jgi:T5orf172 domain-containing protein
MKSGYLYVLVHPSDPDLYKIGVTILHPEERLAQHNRHYEEHAGQIVKETGQKWDLKTYITVSDPYWAEGAFWAATPFADIPYRGFHSFKLREKIELSKGGRSLLQGHGPELNTLESEGQMLQRVMPDQMGLKSVLVLSDEAHHCYREKPETAEEEQALKGDDKKEAEKNREAARMWITGLEAVIVIWV